MGEVIEHLTWYWRRLRAMSPREVAGRTRRTFRHRTDAASFHVSRRAWRARWEPDVESLLHQDVLEATRGFLQLARADGLRRRFSDDAERLVSRADTLIEGRVRFFGYPEVTVDARRSDDIDPFSGRSWPRQHGKRIDYRREGRGDPKWVWELNRCQDLPLLVAAWLASGEPQYAATASDRMVSWIESHPPGRGIAWANGFEAGIRAISLAVTLDALRGTEFLPPARLHRALRSLWQHARWIERDPSTGSSANNHRIGEVAGLVVVGSLAAELKDASRWLDDGLSGLAREADAQIRADGTSVEQAFSYHVFVLDLLLVATAVLDSIGHPVPRAITGALERSGHALWAQLRDDEPEPTYGDSDDGRALILDGDDLRAARGVAAGIAARCGHAKAARVAGTLDSTAWWFFGQSGADRFARVEQEVEAGSVALPDCGLTILRAGRTRAIVDHGPHGHLSIAAHAHADALGLDLALGSARLVVDPGVGSYFAQPKFREAFRGTGFHATVLVDGTDSSSQGGPFMWTHHAHSTLLLGDPSNGVVVAEHDGYARLNDRVTHRRAVVVLGEDSIVVVDRLEGVGAHRYSQRWPLDPALELGRPANHHAVARGREAGLVFAFSASHPFVLQAARGEDDPPAGWWSERLESVVPSWLLTADFEASGAVLVATLLAPFEGSSAPEAQIGLEVTSTATRIEVTHGSDTEIVEVDLGSPAVAVSRNVSAGAA